MTELSLSSKVSSNVSALIQIQSTTASRTGSRDLVSRIANGASSTGTATAAAGAAGKRTDDPEATRAARQFEALLIHNMLKGMRKTTMAEDTTNEMSIYNDMLDEKLATSLMDSGGIGIASQILEQIGSSRGSADSPQPTGSAQRTGSSLSTADTIRIRELAQDIGSSQAGTPGSGRPSSVTDSASTAGVTVSDTADAGLLTRLKMAASLWDRSDTPARLRNQHDFLAPLAPHARRSAQRLGTTPEAVLAIAALETGWGRSMIKDTQGGNSHNLFGIKATSATQPATKTITTEYIDGRPVKTEASFRVYADAAAAVDGFASFLLENPRYSNALQNAADPEQFLKELQVAGYATDPYYADKAISVLKQIQNHELPL